MDKNFSKTVRRDIKLPNARKYPDILEILSIEYVIFHSFIHLRTLEDNAKVEEVTKLIEISFIEY